MEDAHAGPAGSPSKGSVGEEALSPPAPGSLASSKTSTAGAKGDTTGQAAGGPSAACELAQGPADPSTVTTTQSSLAQAQSSTDAAQAVQIPNTHPPSSSQPPITTTTATADSVTSQLIRPSSAAGLPADAPSGNSNTIGPTSGEKPQTAAGTKKFSSSLTVNKKFLEKAGTATDPTKATAAPITRPSNTPSPGVPASAPPLAPSFAPYSSAAPKLLSGKISSASANASSAAPGTKWGRSAATTPTAAGPPPSRYSTLVPPNARGRGAVPSSSAGPKGATGKGRGAVWGQVPQPASGQPASHPRGGRFGSSTDGDFPSVAEAARSSQLKAHAVATALAAKESQDKKAKEEAAAAAAAYQKHMMEEDDAFRGVHLKDHAHWDEMDDDDDFGDVVDFGDGAKYTLQVREQSKAPSPEPEQQQPIISSSTSAPALELAAPTNSRPPVNEFDRGRGTAEGRSLFNDRLGKLEPYSKEQQHKSSHRKVLAPPRPSSSGEAALAEVRQPGRRPSASSHVPFQREPHTAPHASAPQQAAPPLTENRPVDRSAAQRPSPQARQAPLPPTTTNKPAWGTLPPAVQPLDLSRAPDASSNRATSPSHHEQVAASSASIKPPPPMPFARSPEKETAPLPKPDPSSPSISKDDLESYHSEMQSAAERARKRRQEEEDARQAEAERHKLERLKALDERLKANQSPEPPSSTTEKHPVLPATADPPAPSPSLAHRPHKTSSSATAPAKAISPTIPSPQTAVSDATTPNRSDSGPWRAAPAKRTPLPPQEVAAEAALKDLKRETGHRAQKAPQSPHDPPAVDDRTERSWRRSAPVAPSAILQRQKPDKSLSRQTPLTDPPKSPQSSDKKQDVPSSPSMVQSMWPVEALESASSTAAESFDFQTNEVPMRQPRSSEPPSSPDPSAKPSSPATDSPQTHSKVPSAEAEEHSKSVPQVRLSAADAKSPTGHLKQNHKPAISSSSFDDALARIKGVMQASAAQHAASSAGLRPQPETERRNRFDTPHRDSSFHRRLSAEEVTAIERDLATTRRERSVSPRRAWRAIPRMKIPAQSSKVVGPPISMRQLKLFKRGPIQVRPSSVAPAYESARAELFHRRGPFTVKLKPSPKINAVEARPLRDPRPGNAFDSGPWRRGATLRRDEPATEAGDLVATSRDVFDDGLGTPTKPTPSITVVLPTPSAKSSAKIANPAVLPSFPEVGAQVTQPPPGPSKSKVTPGSDPHASEFVPRSAIESTDTHMAAVSSHINPMPWESSDGDSQISVSSSTVPSKINADEAKALSLVKSVWEQPSPEAERDSTARPTNSLDSLMMMDDFPSALPSMADLRSDDGMSAPSSRNLSPVSQGATALPVDASSSSGSHYLHSTLSGLPQQHSPNQGSALPAYRPSSTGHPQKPLNKMPLPGVKSPNSSYGAGLSNGSPYQQPTSQPNQSTLPPPPSSYPAPNFNNNNFSNINPAFSSGIWMPIGQSPPQRASQPNGIAPINTFTSMTPGSNTYPHSDQPNGYPSRGYGSSPRSPGALPFSQHNGPQQYPYGAFAQPSGLSPFPGAVGSGHLGYPHLFPQQQPNAPPPPGNFRKHW